MPLFGSHLSIAGGVYKAVEEAATLGMDTVQIFTASPSQWVVKADAASGRWSSKPLAASDVTQFHDSLKRLKIAQPIAHTSYLINLASPGDELRRKSIEALLVELTRATQLGIRWVVLHPGAAMGAGDDEGLRAVIQSLDEVHERAPADGAGVLLENTAGQGSCLGWRFEHLGAIIRGVAASDRLGVCFDTCHALAAGYPLADRTDYRDTWKQFDEHVGIERLHAFHLNDSKRELGSRVDRHEHIGRGHVGLEAFGHILKDRRFRKLPMYLETPKGKHEGEEWDTINLRALRDLM